MLYSSAIYADNVRHIDTASAMFTVPGYEKDVITFNCPKCKSEPSHSKVEKKEDLQTQEKAKIDVLVKAVENAANKFSPKFARYNSSNRTKPILPRKFRKPAIVPKVFSAMWRYLLAPPPLRSPVRDVSVVLPTVDLTRANRRMLENVPKPTPLPVFGPGQMEVYKISGLNGLQCELGSILEEECVIPPELIIDPAFIVTK